MEGEEHPLEKEWGSKTKRIVKARRHPKLVQDRESNDSIKFGMEDDIRSIWKERRIIRERKGDIQKWEQDEDRYGSIKVGVGG